MIPPATDDQPPSVRHPLLSTSAPAARFHNNAPFSFGALGGPLESRALAEVSSRRNKFFAESLRGPVRMLLNGGAETPGVDHVSMLLGEAPNGVERVGAFLGTADVRALRLLCCGGTASSVYSQKRAELLRSVTAKKPKERLAALRVCLRALAGDAKDALLVAFEADKTQVVRAGAARLLARLAKGLAVNERTTLFRAADARYTCELRMYDCRAAIEEGFGDVFSEDVLARDFHGLLLADVVLERASKVREARERCEMGSYDKPPAPEETDDSEDDEEVPQDALTRALQAFNAMVRQVPRAELEATLGDLNVYRASLQARYGPGGAGGIYGPGQPPREGDQYGGPYPGADQFGGPYPGALARCLWSYSLPQHQTARAEIEALLQVESLERLCAMNQEALGVEAGDALTKQAILWASDQVAAARNA